VFDRSGRIVFGHRPEFEDAGIEVGWLFLGSDASAIDPQGFTSVVFSMEIIWFSDGDPRSDPS
jgi:hypothetical protein